MSGQNIDFMIEARVGRLVLRRATFTTEMLRETLAALGRARSEADVLLIAAAGPDFSLGRDRQEPRSGPPFDAFKLITDVNAVLAEFPGVAVSLVRGRAFGFAVGLILRTDIAIAADDARFALDEIKLGIPPMFIMAGILEHLAPKAASDIIFSSREFGAAEARDMGLVSRVVGADRLGAAGDELIAELKQRDASVLVASKRYLKAIRELPAAARPSFALVEQTRFAERSKH
jgi:enoyl-CoA hydratase/carnithine racemase